MAKLWEKGYSLDAQVEAYMTGDDYLLDKRLIPYDCQGSIAHAEMLHKIGILTDTELSGLLDGLKQILKRAQEGSFEILPEDEDVHTAIENALGELGKKLHTARSRNDQILLDLRLYMRDALMQIMNTGLEAAEAFLQFAEQHKMVPMPGRTHFQRAMPSSMGLWAGAFAESLLDDLTLLQYTYDLINQCPLGSAASYGVSLPIDRQFVSDRLGFRSVQNNVLYANNSRGKFESIVLHACVQIMTSLSKWAADVIIFAAPEFGYLTLPSTLSPGSSLMPQKRNPCPFELMRAKASTVTACLDQVLNIIRTLPSGYNRDFQETKRPLMTGLDITLHTLQVCKVMLFQLQVNAQACLAAFTPEVFATDAVLDRVGQGAAFRDAYREVAACLGDLAMQDPIANIISKTHLGAPGNLNLQFNLEKLLILRERGF